MLILARRPGERVVIGGEIVVCVMEISGSTVRLGIDAPRGISIYREEIWLAVEAENRAAAAVGADALPQSPVGDGQGLPAVSPDAPAASPDAPAASPRAPTGPDAPAAASEPPAPAAE